MQITVPHHIHTTPPPQGVCLQLCKPKLPISCLPPLSRCQVPDAGTIVEKLVIARMLCTIHLWISVSLQLMGMDKMGSELSALISNGILKCSASDGVAFYCLRELRFPKRCPAAPTFQPGDIRFSGFISLCRIILVVNVY